MNARVCFTCFNSNYISKYTSFCFAFFVFQCLLCISHATASTLFSVFLPFFNFAISFFGSTVPQQDLIESPPPLWGGEWHEAVLPPIICNKGMNDSFRNSFLHFLRRLGGQV